MTTNKTPIQELISALQNEFAVYVSNEEEWIKKEKAFAFDCFEAGNMYGIDYSLSLDDGMPPKRPNFDKFYSQYAEQHNK